MRRNRLHGNGDVERKILVEEKGPGYVVFSPENPLDLPEQFPIHLSICCDEWLKRNPAVRVRTVLPIVVHSRCDRNWNLRMNG